MRRVGCALLAVLIAGIAATQSVGQGRGFRGGRGPGQGGRGPDSAFVTDRDDFHFLLRRHDEVRREVNERIDGVETTTESDDPEVAATIQKHVAAMYQRVKYRRPIRMHDPLFAEIFRHADQIKMEVEKTPKGIRVIEWSDDPQVAELIKAHARVVSGFVKHGFAEAHKTHAVPGDLEPGGGPVQQHEQAAAKEFVEFDRVYIPALALTNQKRQEAASKALGRLSTSWDAQFVGDFHEMFREDTRWPRDVSQIAQSIALARTELESGGLLKAHEELEPIRDILMRARRRNGFDYPLDALSQFHATMEAIVKPATTLDASSFDQQRAATLEEVAKRADDQWRTVESKSFDLTAFGKTKLEQEHFSAMVRAEREAITELEAALANGNKASILRAAKGLKPPFAKVYMFFGDFPKPPAETR